MCSDDKRQTFSKVQLTGLKRSLNLQGHFNCATVYVSHGMKNLQGLTNAVPLIHVVIDLGFGLSLPPTPRKGKSLAVIFATNFILCGCSGLGY